MMLPVKKRRREDKYVDEAKFEEPSGDKPAPRRVKKVVKLSNERIVAKNKGDLPTYKEDRQEEQHDNKPRINKKIIADIKLLHQKTLAPSAFISINPKVRKGKKSYNIQAKSILEKNK